MTEWKHIIPVTQFFPEDDAVHQSALSVACHLIYNSLIDNRVFLRYVELPESEIEEFSDIADDFMRYTYPSGGGSRLRYANAEEFDEAMERLYDWADKNRIWID